MVCLHSEMCYLVTGMGRIAIATLAVLFSFLPPSAQAQDGRWHYTVSKYGLRELGLTFSREVLGIETPIKIQFFCHPKDDGTSHGAIGICVSIGNASEIRDFNFSDFEGPDPAIGGRNLMRICVKNHGSTSEYWVCPSGWFYNDAFIFAVEALTKEEISIPKKIIREIIGGSNELEITIFDSENPKTKITMAVPVGESRSHLKALLQGVR